VNNQIAVYFFLAVLLYEEQCIKTASSPIQQLVGKPTAAVGNNFKRMVQTLQPRQGG
jgi:hypothetical protein